MGKSDFEKARESEQFTSEPRQGKSHSLANEFGSGKLYLLSRRSEVLISEDNIGEWREILELGNHFLGALRHGVNETSQSNII